MLGDLPLVDHFPGPDADRGGVFEPPGAHHGGDLGELGLGRGQQPLAMGGALLCQEGVVAGDQPFSGVVR